MKIALTGASGLLGRALFAHLSNIKNFQVIGAAFSRAVDPLIKLDLCDHESVKAFVKTQNPDILIHSAAERRPEEVEKNPDNAFKLNVESTEVLADLCSSNGTYLIYISTDYVFDGDDPPYEVDAKPNPLNKYGEMKLAGELAIKNHEDLKWCILRVPVLYGRTIDLNESAVTILYNNLKRSVETKQTIKMNHIEKRFPTLCDDIAKFLIEVCLLYDSNRVPVGILHFSGVECLTKFEMVKIMASLKNVSLGFVEAETVSTSTVKRPHNCQLSMKKCDDLGLKYTRTPFEDGLKIVLNGF